MHPALIPDRHPMCGKYMEALVACRLENPTRKFFGSCTEVTYQLTECLAIEKKITRAPRQAQYKQRWEAKKSEDFERMGDLTKQDCDNSGSQSTSDTSAGGSSSSGSSSSSKDPSSRPAHETATGASLVKLAVGSSLDAASVSEPSVLWKPSLRSGARQIGSQGRGPIVYSKLCDGLQVGAGHGSLFE